MSIIRIFAPVICLIAVSVASFPVGLLSADWLGFGRVWFARLLFTLWFTTNVATLYGLLFLKTIPDSWLEANVQASPDSPGDGSHGIGLDHSAIFSPTSIVDPGPVNESLFDAIEARGGVWFVQPAIFEVAARQTTLEQTQPGVL